MKSKRKLLVRLIAFLAVIAIAAWMFVIGRGHTIYFDNKTLEADGQTYEAPYQIQVLVDGESVGKLKEGDRGMTTTMGQDFEMILAVTKEKGDKKAGAKVSLKLPYNMDGIILNLPALLGGASEDVYRSEFIPTPVVEEEEEEVPSSDEFEMPMGDE